MITPHKLLNIIIMLLFMQLHASDIFKSCITNFLYLLVYYFVNNVFLLLVNYFSILICFILFMIINLTLYLFIN